MKKMKWFYILFLFICFGCSTQKQNDMENRQRMGKKDFGDIVYSNQADGDPAIWDTFMNEKSQYKEASIRIIHYTKEGDPIIRTLEKSKHGYTLTIDHSEDNFKGDSLPFMSKTFKYLHKVNGKDYRDAVKDSVLCFEQDPALFTYWFVSDYPKSELFEKRDPSTYKTPSIIDPYIIFSRALLDSEL